VPRRPRGVVRIKGRQVATALGGLALIAAIALLPDLARRGNTDNQGIQAFRGRIESIRPPAVDSDPATPPVPTALVRALDGPRAGELLGAILSGPGGSQTVANYRAGEEVLVTITRGPAGTEPVVAVSDRWRLPVVQALVLVFAVVVVVVGGWHGVRALIALGLTIVVLIKILLPLLVSGVPPVPLAVVAATGITIATIVLTEGWKQSSFAAILGTAGSLALIGLFAAAATSFMGFTYAAGDLAFLTTVEGEGLDLRGALLAAIILGAVGVLDDVTVTQAVLVDELSRTNLRGGALVATAMRVGRSHIAATINTLFLAYVGGGLPLLVVLFVSRLPDDLLLSDEAITIEIVRAIAGSLGILAAVPVTTVIAAALAGESTGSGETPGQRRRRLALITGAAGLVSVLLLATAVLPLTAGPRPALVPEVFEPIGPGPTTVGRPTASPGSSDSDRMVLVGTDEPVTIEIDGEEVGQVRIVDTAVTPPSEASRSTVSALVRYEASAAWNLGRGEWSVLRGDGAQFPLTADDPAVLASELPAGEVLDVAVAGVFEDSPEAAFVVYIDAPTSTYHLALPLE
jgi:uncharacterized membrane protein